MGTQQRIGIIVYTTIQAAATRIEEEEEEEEEELCNVSVVVDTIS